MSETTLPRPAVFIDRDGTINEDVDYLADVTGLRIYDFAAEAIRLLKDNGFLVVVVTNQSGIGRGLIREDSMHAIHDQINRTVGSFIDAFYYCPHRPDENCGCRKPAVEMVRRAVADLNIDLGNSWMIGDKKADVETGFNAGTATALVLTGYGEAHLASLERMPDIVADNLLEAALHICDRHTDGKLL